MDRRTFLRNAALTSGAAMLGSTALSSCWWGQGAGGGLGTAPPGPGGRNMLEFAASSCPVQRVVLVMMENRSFDHWLGWMANDEAYLEAGRSRLRGGLLDRRGGAPDLSRPERAGGHRAHARSARRREPVAGLRPPRPRARLEPRPSASVTAGSSPPARATTSSRSDGTRGPTCPFTGQLAKRFCTFDRYHASVLGPTYPNREYFWSRRSRAATRPTPAPDERRLPVGHDLRPVQHRRRLLELLLLRPPGHRRSGARACCRSRHRSTTSSSAAPTARCPRCRSSTPGS